MFNKNQLINFLKLTDNNEKDPLGDKKFESLETGYVIATIEEVVLSVEAFFKKTDGVITQMGAEVSKEQLYGMLSKELGIEFNSNLPKRIREVTKQAVNDIYDHTKQQIIQTTFSLPDVKATEYLKSSDNFYVGKLFGRYSEKMREVLRDAIDKGYGSTDIAKIIKNDVGDFINLKYYEYERVARTSSNRVRNWAKINSLHEAGIKVYTITAMLDERTSEICKELDGTQFEVLVAKEHID